MNDVVSIQRNEGARLEALRRYEILDTEAEQAYDDLIQLASVICCCPIALLSLVDRDRQWFKSKVGVSASETQRDISFCTHAIENSEMLIVRDATHDPRFKDSPLVTDEPNICFYAGMPLVTFDGFALGAFCVIDRQPRELSAEQLFSVKALARQAMTLIELRRGSRQLAEALQNLKLLEGLLPICAHCKKIRDKGGEWQVLERFISDHSNAEFTHGICPSCTQQLYAELEQHVRSRH